jgi:hypothetical protein
MMRCADDRRTTLKMLKPLQKLMQESNILVDNAQALFVTSFINAASAFFVHLSSDAASKHVRQAVGTNGLLAMIPG